MFKKSSKYVTFQFECAGEVCTLQAPNQEVLEEVVDKYFKIPDMPLELLTSQITTLDFILMWHFWYSASADPLFKPYEVLDPTLNLVKLRLLERHEHRDSWCLSKKGCNLMSLFTSGHKCNQTDSWPYVYRKHVGNPMFIPWGNCSRSSKSLPLYHVLILPVLKFYLYNQKDLDIMYPEEFEELLGHIDMEALNSMLDLSTPHYPQLSQIRKIWEKMHHNFHIWKTQCP